MVKELVKTGKIQYWSDVNQRLFNGRKNIVYRDAQEFGLMEGFTHGIPDLRGRFMSAFYFAGDTMENNTRGRMIIERLVPFLCEKLSRIVIEEKAEGQYRLTHRERDWLRQRIRRHSSGIYGDVIAEEQS